MFTIRQVSEMTGLTAYTLRYYEKIGLLPAPKRKTGGARVYSESDLRFMSFLNGLKKTGMSLEEIAEFVKEGCIFEKVSTEENLQPSLTKRIDILSKHLIRMEEQRQEIENLIMVTKEKLSIYHDLLGGTNQ